MSDRLPVVFSPTAAQSLEELHYHIAHVDGRPETADAVRDAIRTTLEKVTAPETRNSGTPYDAGCRALQAKNCTLIYRTSATALEVVDVIYNRRNRPPL
jgi:plasmid stabilization system protein ParE